MVETGSIGAMSMQADLTGGEHSVPGTEEGSLLPGERDDTDFREDAQHWVTVYEAMVTHARELAADGGGLDAALTTSLARYQRRLEFWRKRLHDLSR